MHFERCLQMHYSGSTKRAQRCKNMSKMPQNQGRGLMLDWTRSQNARRTVGTVACFLPVLAIVLWGPSSAFTIAGISITRASTQQSCCSLQATLHQSIIIVSAYQYHDLLLLLLLNAMLSRSSTVLAMPPTGFSRAGFYRGSGF